MVPPSFGNVNCETAWTTLASGLDETPEQPVADEYGNEPRTPTRSGRPMRPERRVGSGVSGLCLVVDDPSIARDTAGTRTSLPTIEHMTLQRMEHVGIVVDDLATEFFVGSDSCRRAGGRSKVAGWTASWGSKAYGWTMR
jgi:hypothetical protein